MLKDLVKVAGRLDSLGLSSEANFIDAVVRKFAGDLVQFPKEVWQDKPKMSAAEIRAEKKRRYEERSAHQRMLEGDMRAQDEQNNKYRHPSLREDTLEQMMAEVEAHEADREENELRRPYPSGAGMGSGFGRGSTMVDSFRTRDSGSLKSPSKKSRKGKPIDDFSDDADDMFDSDGNLIDLTDFEQEIGDEDFNQYDNPEETSFRGREAIAPGRGRSVYVPSDDANDMQRLAKRLASLGLTKEARFLMSIIKNASEDVSPKAHHVGLMARNRAQDEGLPFHTWDAEYDDAVAAYKEANPEYFGEEDLSGEGKFSDDAWDDGNTEPYHFKNTEGDEEKKAKKEREWNLMLYGKEDPTPDEIAGREEERNNMNYFGTPEGHSAVRYNRHTGEYTGGRRGRG